MLFNSVEFIYFFLPLTVILFYTASRFRWIKLSKYILLSMSFIFYAYWKLSYFLLIVFKIISNYFLAVLMDKKRSWALLWAGVIFNLGILCYFKYLGFFTGILHELTPMVPVLAATTIPLGISFYTFTQLAYLEDLHYRKTRFYGLTQYSLFVIFFPHLIAGPIVHYGQIMPQFDRLRTYLAQHRNFFKGIFFFLLGLFQKAVIADAVGPLADAGFANAHLLSFVESWGALLAYALQIYFDFAGYSNMAIGLGLLFNIRFPANFDSPYQAASIIDFWRRWHMTLSQFLRDYVYVRLGGNRLGEMRKYANIFLTMLIGGLWHGAGWTFILWGGYHGALLVGNHAADKAGFKLPLWLGQALTFLLVLYGWVLFRSSNLEIAGAMTSGLAGLRGWGFGETHFIWKRQLLWLLVPMAVAFFAPNAEYWAKKIKPTLSWGIVFSGMLIMDILYLNRESAFLYFQF